MLKWLKTYNFSEFAGRRWKTKRTCFDYLYTNKKGNLHDGADKKCQSESETRFPRPINLFLPCLRHESDIFAIDSVEIKQNFPRSRKKQTEVNTQHRSSVCVENSKVVFYVKSLFFVLNFPPVLFSSNRKYFFSSEEKGRKKKNKTSVTQTTENGERADKRENSFGMRENSWELFSVSSWVSVLCMCRDRITHRLNSPEIIAVNQVEASSFVSINHR